MPRAVMACPGIISFHLFHPAIPEKVHIMVQVYKIVMSLLMLNLPVGGNIEKFVYLAVLGTKV